VIKASLVLLVYQVLKVQRETWVDQVFLVFQVFQANKVRRAKEVHQVMTDATELKEIAVILVCQVTQAYLVNRAYLDRKVLKVIQYR